MKHIINFLKGIAVGIATLVPGVSGGTMAIILGIYDSLIHAVGSFFKDWKKHTILLFEVGIGGLLGIVLFSRLMEFALDKYPYVMGFLFLGVIFGGLPVLYRKSVASEKRDIKDYIYLILGFAIVLLMTSKPEFTNNIATSHDILSMIFLFIGGIILAVALVLPGISGSFMLLALGIYDITINAINDRNILFLVPLGLGVAAGTLGTAKLIETVLKKYPGKTYMMILGFVLGSLIPVFPGIPTGFEILASIVVFFIGFIVIYMLGKKGFTD